MKCDCVQKKLILKRPLTLLEALPGLLRVGYPSPHDVDRLVRVAERSHRSEAGRGGQEAAERAPANIYSFIVT